VRTAKALKFLINNHLGWFWCGGQLHYADGKTAAGTPLVGMSEDTYNLTGYFENKRVSAHLGYTFRFALSGWVGSQQFRIIKTMSVRSMHR